MDVIDTEVRVLPTMKIPVYYSSFRYYRNVCRKCLIHFAVVGMAGDEIGDATTPANFCPYCGRALKEVDDE